MIDYDEESLICDLAETYQIYDYRSLPLRLVATLSAGLGDNSRIMKKRRGFNASLDTILLAIIADRLNIVITGKTEMPLTDWLTGSEPKSKSKVKGFKSGNEFDVMWQKINGD